MRKIIFLFIMPLLITPVFGKTAEAIFAGGCFWCVEADFDKVPGVVATVSGFDGGTINNPSYQLVSSGQTQYAEAVKVTYDPNTVTYKELVDYFWRHIDPTVNDEQFCDHGQQYRSAIFYLNDEQKKIAEASKKQLTTHFKTIYTQIIPSTKFYAAEPYHQNYYQKNPIRYKYYRWRCGRDQRLEEVWSHEKT